MSAEQERDLNTANRLVATEQRGLKIAVMCRTAVVAIGAAWWIGANLFSNTPISPWAIGLLLFMTLYGLVTGLLIGTRFDRWWLKYGLYAVDILAICAFYVFVPLRAGADIPQIIAFRAYGIYFLFPLVALACLSLSWGLVLWSGAVSVVGWWTAYLWIFSGMERPLGWADFPDDADLADYEEIFLSVDFAGSATRLVESSLLMMSAAILALAVYRARQVFFAQIKAEQDWLAEQKQRERVTAAFGRYVPEAIARELIDKETTLEPQVRHTAVLILDVAGFSEFSSSRSPSEVIETLNDFLSEAADRVSDKGGVVIQFTGDGLLATFNTPIEVPDPERAACDAARALVASAKSVDFRVRVGLATGPVAAGSVGSANRQAYTVYGDTVNRAARLEPLGKTLNAEIVMDDATASAIGLAGLKPCGKHDLKGLANPVDVWIAD